MAFRTNSSKASENTTLKEEGFYEVIIEDAKTAVTPNGKDTISLKYVIRNDVEQKYKNGLIFHSIWKRNEPNEDDIAVGGFNYANLMAIAKAAKIPDNQEFADLDEFLKALIGKAVKVDLYHDEYNGKKYEKVAAHYATDVPKIKHKPKDKPSAASAAGTASTAASANADVADAADNDDYPF